MSLIKRKFWGRGREENIISNEEAIKIGMKAFYEMQNEYDKFKKLDESLVLSILEQKVNHKIRPLFFQEDRLLKIAYSKLEKFIKVEDVTAEDCANALLETLFTPKIHKTLDFITRWNLASWINLVFNILKSIFGF